jgi:hypothetical protein
MVEGEYFSGKEEMRRSILKVNFPLEARDQNPINWSQNIRQYKYESYVYEDLSKPLST